MSAQLDLLDLREAPATEEIDDLISRVLRLWQIAEAAGAPDRKTRTKVIGRIGAFQAEGMFSGTFRDGWYDVGIKGAAVTTPGAVRRLDSEIWPEGHRVAAGEIEPCDGIRLYRWRELLERAIGAVA